MPLILALVLGGLWLLRRKAPAKDAVDFESDETEQSAPEALEAGPRPSVEAPTPSLTTGPASAPAAPPPTPPMPRPSFDPAAPKGFAPDSVELVLEAQRLTTGLVNATLAYRISLVNRGREAIGPVSIASDIIAAHASRSAGEQLALDPQTVEPRHQFLSLFPGESITLTGEVRLPLAEIRPIRKGNAALFVPLARFRIVAAEKDKPPRVSTRIFVIGESPEQPGGRLRPFRLDQGPRTFSRIGQRDVTVAA